MPKLLSLDTETTGVDFYHGARPYFVTTCTDEGEQQWWEWEVDPLTREPQIPVEDVQAILELIESADEMVLQNGKFDAAAIQHITLEGFEWPWHKCQDTLSAGHILASNQPHNLTDMAVHYLGVNILPLEKELEKAVQEARRIARTNFPEWLIAKEGLECMPSASEKTWKYDTWLPRAMALAWEEKNHPWLTVAQEYANADSVVTIKLWEVMLAEMKRRGLYEIYLEKKKQLQVTSEMIELPGLAVLQGPLKDLQKEYLKESGIQEAYCKTIAAKHHYDLVLPKGSANNKSLSTFLFNVLKLPVLKWTEGGSPGFDKDVVDEYKKTLDPTSDQFYFIKALSGKRKRSKSLEFLSAYEKFSLPCEYEGYRILHPSANPTATATTRFSMSNPNLQQVSKDETECEFCKGEGCDDCDGTGEDLHSVRRVFGPLPDEEMWTMDAQNIELRLPAYESGEPDLIALFERPKDPPFYGSQHLLNFSIVYEDVWEAELKGTTIKTLSGRVIKGDGVGLDKVGPHCKSKYKSSFYQFTKNGDFAIQYQCGEAMADKTFRVRGAFKKLKSKFNKLEALNQKWCAFAQKHGYVETIIDRSLGVNKGYPLLCTRNERGSIIPTLPLNYRTQGSAGWWMIKAMNRCYDKLKEWEKEGFKGRIALTVHDELMFILPKRADPRKDPKRSNLQRVRILQKLMAKGGEDFGIPTPVSVEYHPVSWAEGVTF